MLRRPLSLRRSGRYRTVAVPRATRIAPHRKQAVLTGVVRIAVAVYGSTAPIITVAAIAAATAASNAVRGRAPNGKTDKTVIALVATAVAAITAATVVARASAVTAAVTGLHAAYPDVSATVATEALVYPASAVTAVGNACSRTAVACGSTRITIVTHSRIDVLLVYLRTVFAALILHYMPRKPLIVQNRPQEICSRLNRFLGFCAYGKFYTAERKFFYFGVGYEVAMLENLYVLSVNVHESVIAWNAVG